MPGGGQWWAVGKLVRRWTLDLGMPNGPKLCPASVWTGHPRGCPGWGLGAGGGIEIFTKEGVEYLLSGKRVGASSE